MSVAVHGPRTRPRRLRRGGIETAATRSRRSAGRLVAVAGDAVRPAPRGACRARAGAARARGKRRHALTRPSSWGHDRGREHPHPRRADRRGDPPGPGPLPRRRHHQARPRRLPRADCAVDAPPSARPSAHPPALPRGDRPPRVHAEGRPRAAGLGAPRRGPQARRHRGPPGRGRCGHPRRARQPLVRHPPSLAEPRGPPRAARPSHLRPRPVRRRRRPAPRRRLRAARAARGDRPRRVRQDDRVARPPRRRPARRTQRRGRGPRRRPRRRHRARRPDARRPHPGVAQGEAGGTAPRRHRPQRVRADCGRALVGPPAPRRAGGGAAPLGGARRPRLRGARTHPPHRSGAGRGGGRPWAEMSRHARSLTGPRERLAALLGSTPGTLRRASGCPQGDLRRRREHGARRPSRGPAFQGQGEQQ